MKGVMKDKGVLVLGAALAALFFGPSEAAFAHSRWKTDSTVLVPRSTSSGLKTGPCGGVPRTATPKVFSPGQVIEVEWEETINHPGSFRIAFSPADDLGFDDHVLYSVADMLGAETPMPHFYKATITLPMQACASCTLQLIQIMTDTMPPSNYYSCADIQLVADGGNTGSGTGGGSTPPAVPDDIKIFAQSLLDDFNSADMNKDNALSFSEIQSVYPSVTAEQFNQLDVTKDGLLSVPDLEAIAGSSSGTASNPPASGNTGRPPRSAENSSSAGSFDWTLLLLGIAYLLLLRDRRKKARLHGHLPHYYDLLPPRRR